MIKKFLFVTLFTLSLFVTNLTHADNKISIKTPPASLAQWYKPHNKRQVWLHTMFRLRREMLAIEEYADTNPELMKKWIHKLEADYLKISDMVPEWSNMLDTGLIAELKHKADTEQLASVKKYLRKIQKTCNNCHYEYKPLVTALYRSPDYNHITVTDNHGKSLSFNKSMRELPKSINRIQIALADEQPQIALQNSMQLEQQLKHLASACQQCHQDNPSYIQSVLGHQTTERLLKLTSSIKDNKVAQSQKLLGEIGVTVCARCHSTHRTLSDLRNSLEDRMNSE